MWILMHGSGLLMTHSGLFSTELRSDIFFMPAELLDALRVAHHSGVHVYAVNVAPKLNQKAVRAAA